MLVDSPKPKSYDTFLFQYTLQVALYLTVYRSTRPYDTWTEDGINGAEYGRNKSGWFDLGTSEKWFCKMLLPYAKKLQGPKVTIGINLSSYLSINIIKLCEENNIRYDISKFKLRSSSTSGIGAYNSDTTDSESPSFTTIQNNRRRRVRNNMKRISSFRVLADYLGTLLQSNKTVGFGNHLREKIASELALFPYRERTKIIVNTAMRHRMCYARIILLDAEIRKPLYSKNFVKRIPCKTPRLIGQ
ncbi:hypothetical protein ANN_07658 [Periplaneta americana]|uniref:Uncharacterized protein n=1 Tax=Periplaneta americana TaxID=6978 RepID=A0ABQ8T0F3_PERAM|nr:hypothetical protein ANN_07658 [Periplaneta americana]